MIGIVDLGVNELDVLNELSMFDVFVRSLKVEIQMEGSEYDQDDQDEVW